MTTAAQACQLLLQRCEKLDAVDRTYFALVARGIVALDIRVRLERYAAFLGLHGVKFSNIEFPQPPALSPPREDRTIAANGVAFLARYGRGDAAADVAIHSLAGARWEPTLRAMRIPGSPAVVEALRGLERSEGWVFCESADLLCEEVVRRASERAAASRAADGRFRIEGLLGELRGYQEAAVEFCTRDGKGFIADDMGLGKTAQALGTIQALQAWPAVVVTIAACTLQWEDEAVKWLDGVRCVHWNGRTGTPANCEPMADDDHILHIVNYANLPFRIEGLLAMNPLAVIYDESHHLRHGTSARTKAARKLAARRLVRLLLTGTPLENGEPQEVLSQIQLLGSKVMNALGGWHHVTTRYLDKKMRRVARGKVIWDFSGGAHLEEFHERLRQTCYLRRTKAQVLPELPPKIVTHVPLGMRAEGWARYETAAGNIKVWLAQKAAVDPGWEAKIAHLDADAREAARARRYAEAIDRLDGQELLQRLGTLREVAAEGKLPLAAEWARELCADPRRKLVAFAHNHTIVKGIAALLPDLGALVIDGPTPVRRRREIVQRYREDATVRFLSISILAGGTGIDGLQHAGQDVAFLQEPWTPAGRNQAADRLHRLGQRGTVEEWHLLARGTVDEEMLALLDLKSQGCDAIADGISPKEAAIGQARRVAKGMMGGGG